MKNEEQQNQPAPKHGRIIFPLYTIGKVLKQGKEVMSVLEMMLQGNRYH